MQFALTAAFFKSTAKSTSRQSFTLYFLLEKSHSCFSPAGQSGGQSGDGVNEDGFVGLRAGLPLPVMFIIAGVFLIYRKHKKRRRHGLYYHV